MTRHKRNPDHKFTFLWCINVRLHSINYSLRELGRLCARRAEVKGKGQYKIKCCTLHRTSMNSGNVGIIYELTSHFSIIFANDKSIDLFLWRQNQAFTKGNISRCLFTMITTCDIYKPVDMIKIFAKILMSVLIIVKKKPRLCRFSFIRF